MFEFLVWFLASIVSIFGVSYFYFKVTGAKSKINKKIILILLVGALFYALIKYYNISYITVISYYFITPFLFYAIKPLPLKKFILYSIIIWLYGMILDLLSMIIVVIVTTLFDFDIANHFNFATILLSMFVFIMFVFLANIKKVKLFTEYLYKSFLKLKFSNFSLVILSVFIFFVGMLIFINMNHLQVDLLLFLVIILMILIFLLLILYKMNNDEMKKYLKTLKENNEFYIKLDDENRTFRHNLNAKLLSIKSVSNKKAMALIDDLIGQFEKTKKFTKGIKIIPYGLNGIIYQKLHNYMDKLNIDIQNRIDYDIFEYLTPRRYNVFVEKMVVALDNAIESALKSDKKIISIDLYDEDGKIFIEVKNSFNESINVDELGTKNYSTKGKRRGIGLFSIIRSNEAKVSFEIVNDLFITKVITRKKITE